VRLPTRQDYSGNRHTTATLTGQPDLAQREKAEDQTQDRPDQAKPPEQGAHQRRDGHTIRIDALWRRRGVGRSSVKDASWDRVADTLTVAYRTFYPV
jgi:hypothetical protein